MAQDKSKTSSQESFSLDRSNKGVRVDGFRDAGVQVIAVRTQQEGKSGVIEPESRQIGEGEGFGEGSSGGQETSGTVTGQVEGIAGLQVDSGRQEGSPSTSRPLLEEKVG